MSVPRNLTNHKFGKLTALQREGTTKDGKIIWYCSCECGAFTRVIGGNLVSGGTTSCGCTTKEKNISRAFDLTGLIFSRLTVTASRGHLRKHKLWECLCICGNTCLATTPALRGGAKTSCGCRQRSVNTTHGLSGTPVYKVWAAMNSRCSNPGNKSFGRYGGRGIVVCNQWQGSTGFATFTRDMGPRPVGFSLDRIDNNLGYCPENCRWTTPKEQARNRCDTRLFTLGKSTRPLKEWAALAGVSEASIRGRIQRGWDLDRALTSVDTRKCRHSIPP